jgi:HAD superfamily hydrolase (TIGR01549 family)
MTNKQTTAATNTIALANTDRQFECILFDLGHTIWYRDEQLFKPLEMAANQQAIAFLRQAGQTISLPGKDDHAAGQWLRATLRQQFAYEVALHPHLEPTGSAMLEKVLLAAGMETFDEEFRQTLFEILNIRIAQSRRLYPDALATLDYLQQCAVQLGVVTNRYWGGAAFQTDLKTLGLLDYFQLEMVMTSADLHIRKPNPAIFSLALEACQAEETKTIMVGDSLVADVAGSQQLGLCAIWKPQQFDAIESYLAAEEGITVQEYNRRQVDLLQRTGVIEAPALQEITGKKASDLELFASGTIRPQLIIQNLSELTAWLV